MLSRYDSTCSFCHRPTKAGLDEYDYYSKKSFHVECQTNQPPGPAEFALAEKRGFRSFSREELMGRMEGDQKTH